MTSARLAAVAVLLLPATAVAQPERYELGRRLRQFEAEWERQTDPAARKKALEGLPKLTGQFFGLKFGEAGRTLDEARFALGKEPVAGVRCLTALSIQPEKRLVDAETPALKVVVKPFYPVPGGVPAGATATVRIGNGPAVAVPLDKLPATLSVPFPPGGWAGDWLLTLEGATGGDTVLQQVRVSAVRGLLAYRLDAMNDAVARHQKTGAPATLESATFVARVEQLTELADGGVPETDVAADRLFLDLWFLGLKTGFGGMQFSPKAVGDQWLAIPTGKKRSVPCRLWVPPGLTAEKPVPLVVALHGAGGTENLFFDGYGAGRVVKECAERGWLLVAPQCGFTGPPAVDVLIDKLAERYPIDRKRVFLVGHSMGAANAVSVMQAHPDRFAAMACLGGGGRVTEPKAFAGKGLFVGVGDQDFALTGARALAKALGVPAKEYPGVEHMLIVREALPDVFAGFDRLK